MSIVCNLAHNLKHWDTVTLWMMQSLNIVFCLNHFRTLFRANTNFKKGPAHNMYFMSACACVFFSTKTSRASISLIFKGTEQLFPWLAVISAGINLSSWCLNVASAAGDVREVQLFCLHANTPISTRAYRLYASPSLPWRDLRNVSQTDIIQVCLCLIHWCLF